jgi:hypothetical protein
MPLERKRAGANADKRATKTGARYVSRAPWHTWTSYSYNLDGSRTESTTPIARPIILGTNLA